MLCSPALPLLRVQAFGWAQDSSRSSAPGAMSVSLPSGFASPLFSIYDFPGQEAGMGASHCSTSVTPLAGTHDSTVSPGAGGSPSWSSVTNRSHIQQSRKQAPRKSRLLLLPIDSSGFRQLLSYRWSFFSSSTAAAVTSLLFPRLISGHCLAAS